MRSEKNVTGTEWNQIKIILNQSLYLEEHNYRVQVSLILFSKVEKVTEKVPISRNSIEKIFLLHSLKTKRSRKMFYTQKEKILYGIGKNKMMKLFESLKKFARD